jgi:homoserine O-acetyltransferase/O-succinyltransferase
MVPIHGELPKTICFENVTLQSGVTLPSVTIVYKTYGELNDAGDNCILLPTYYTGTHDSYARLIGRDRALDPAKYFVVIPNLLGNGLSSSPSNTAVPFRASKFPNISVADNVRLQYRLLTETLNVQQIALVYGWSMGAMQAFSWAAVYPELVQRLLPVCGSARCWPLNYVFLEGVRSALMADPNFMAGNYASPPEAGLRAFGRSYAGWAYSAAFYREALYRNLGYTSLEAFLTFWEDDHLTWDANDLLAMLWTWQNANLSSGELKNITAKTIVMPCDQDMYFTLDEARFETAEIPNAELRTLYSAYGHCAGAPGLFPAETAFLEQTIRELLAR